MYIKVIDALTLLLIVLTSAIAHGARSHPTTFDEFRAWVVKSGKAYLHDEQVMHAPVRNKSSKVVLGQHQTAR